MTREEILNTPEIVDFMIDKSVMVDSKMKLHNRLNELCKLAIKALEQEPKWIPVSERLPEKNVWVLVTVEQSGVRHQEIMRRNNFIDTWTDNIDNYNNEITAWMPLPEPYRKEGVENE